MFQITEVTDECENKPAIQLRIETNATPEAIEEARAALPESVRRFLRPTRHIQLILAAVAATDVRDPAFSARFVLP